MSSVQKPFSVPVDLFVLPSAALRSEHGLDWLSHVGVAERERASRFHNPDDALNYTAQQTLMRCMAASALGTPPACAAGIAVERSCLLCDSGLQHGKPRIAGVNLSMSRSAGLVAGALVAGNSAQDAALRLGADVERLSGSLFEGFDRIALTKSEADILAGLQAGQAEFVRLMLWTAKEAVLKATGHGLSVEPQAVETNLRQLPETATAVDGFISAAMLSLPGTSPQRFWVCWRVVQGKFFVAVALDAFPLVRLHTVTTPQQVRRLIETR